VAETWGPEGPPEEAYSRVTRDLAVVTAAFAEYLEDLAGRLTAAYDCVVREPDQGELERLSAAGSRAIDCFVIAPVDPLSAPLLIARDSFEGGTTAVVGLGRVVDEMVPDCLCDACDADSASSIAQMTELVDVATHGFREFRRPYVAGPDELLWKGPWTQIGYEVDGEVMWSRAGHTVKGEEFSVSWRPWARLNPG
jgi:hypothetical protein